MPEKISIKRVLYVVFPVVLVVTITLLVAFSSARGQQVIPEHTPFAQLIKKQEETPQEKTSYNVLLLGYGGAGHSGGGLADAQVLAHLDTKNKKLVLIAIPRDLWVNLPVQSDKSEHYKINNAFAIGNSTTLAPNKTTEYSGINGGGKLAMKAVEMVTGLTIDNYAAVDFGRFIKSIDALKGIDVDVPKTFDDYFFPIKGLEDETCGFTLEQIEEFKQKYTGFELEKQFTCRYEHLHFDKGTTHMDGETALKFIRSRHSDQDGGDFARGIREQAVLIAIKNKLLSLDAINKIDDFYAQFRQLITTDVDQDKIAEVLVKLGNPGDYTVTKLNLNTDNYLDNSVNTDGQYILVPKLGLDNWGQIQNYIKQGTN